MCNFRHVARRRPSAHDAHTAIANDCNEENIDPLAILPAKDWAAAAMEPDEVNRYVSFGTPQVESCYRQQDQRRKTPTTPQRRTTRVEEDQSS